MRRSPSRKAFSSSGNPSSLRTILPPRKPDFRVFILHPIYSDPSGSIVTVKVAIREARQSQPEQLPQPALQRLLARTPPAALKPRFDLAEANLVRRGRAFHRDGPNRSQTEHMLYEYNTRRLMDTESCGSASHIPFAEYCANIQEHLKQAYHLNVVTRDIPDPLTGDLDGLEIHIDPAVSPEQRLFLLAHLFGHTVQWNVNPRAFEVGRLFLPPVNEDLLPTIVEYEQEAASLALAVFHQIGITGVDQWFSDYSACDLAYLSHYYRTGEKRIFQSFWRDNTLRIEPKPIPPFTPRKRVFRCDGIVI